MLTGSSTARLSRQEQEAVEAQDDDAPEPPPFTTERQWAALRLLFRDRRQS